MATFTLRKEDEKKDRSFRTVDLEKEGTLRNVEVFKRTGEAEVETIRKRCMRRDSLTTNAVERRLGSKTGMISQNKREIICA